jgi:hypothetical protein
MNARQQNTAPDYTTSMSAGIVESGSMARFNLASVFTCAIIIFFLSGCGANQPRPYEENMYHYSKAWEAKQHDTQ